MKTQNLKPCPHCGSSVHWKEYEGSMKSWPAVAIICDSKDCYGGMRRSYDELGGTTAESLMGEIAENWNRRV